MENIIRAIWNSQITGKDDSKEKNELKRLKERHKSAILNELGSNGKVIFEKYEDCETELDCIILEETFAEGVKFAVKLFVESLN